MQHLFRLVLVGFSLLCCQVVFAQWARIGSIDVYGNRTTDEKLVLQKLQLGVGDRFNRAIFKPAQTESNLLTIPGVKKVKVNLVCCDTSGSWMLFVGIGETDSETVRYRKAPTQKLKLPEIMTEAYDDLNGQLEPAIKSGQATEDDSHGYALLTYKPARNDQIKFTGFAEMYFNLLAEVIENSGDAGQRAAAANIIAYGANKKEVARCLLQAIDDPDDEVRNNATRALGVLASYLGLHPEIKVSIPAEPFIKMINSIVWTDRNKGLMVLAALTKQRDKEALAQLRLQALPSIIEMAKWKDRGHSMNAFLLLGRIAGAKEEELVSRNFSPQWTVEVEQLTEQCAHQ